MHSSTIREVLTFPEVPNNRNIVSSIHSVGELENTWSKIVSRTMLRKVISVQLSGDLFRRASYTTPNRECESWRGSLQLGVAASPVEAYVPIEYDIVR